jgi:imidazolonepropionase-like amidohydrolase
MPFISSESPCSCVRAGGAGRCALRIVHVTKWKRAVSYLKSKDFKGDFMIKRLATILLLLLQLLLLPVSALTQTNQKPQSKPLVLTHVTVIDTKGAPSQPDMTVIITGDRVTNLGRTGKIRVPKGAQVINATGKFLIPGLWDMHAHLSFYADMKQPHPPLTAFPALIANGVTGVRDMGGNLEQINKWRKEIAGGTLIGPRIVIAGPYVDGPKKMNEFRASLTVVVKTPEEARQAVKDLKRRGVDFIKVHNGISRDAYLALADECRRQGIPLATHLPRSVRLVEASDARTHSLEHIEMLTESISFDVAAGEKPKDPLMALAELTDDKAKTLFARFARNGTWYDPTLVAYRAFVQEAEENVLKDAGWKKAVEGRTALFRRYLVLVGMMQRGGVGILAGTDFARKRSEYPYPVTQPGTDLHEELALFVEAGMSPLQALQTATLNPARFLNSLHDYGTVEKGRMADLVLLNANPLENIKNTRKIFAVVVGGKYILQTEPQVMLDKVEAEATRK